MSTTVVPTETKTAAKRGFVRTTAQAYATALAGGVSATVVIQLATGELQLLPVAITAAVTALSPLLAGLASALSILANGVPEDYAAAAGRHAA